MVAALLGAPAAAAAQVTDTQAWSDLYLSAHPTKGVLVSGEVINRTVDDLGREGQVETRLQVGHAFTPKLTGWAGWVRFTTFNKTGADGIENHAVEQLNWTPGKLGRVAVALRTRLEQRAISGVAGTSWRVREQVRLVLPVSKHGTSLVAWGEPFLSLNRTAAQPYVLERVRSFAGVNVPLARHVDVEAGYLNEYLHRPVSDRDNHVLSVVLSVRL